MSTTSLTAAAGCVEFASLFQDPLLEEAPASGASAAQRRRYAVLIQEARAVCAACPLFDACLYRAIVDVDVAGFAAATTPQQRSAIRARLRITVQPEDFDTLAGVLGRNRPVDHDEVLRLRHANPHESLEQLAQRLGCSLSTVKRHLRKERNSPAPTATGRPRPSLSHVRAVTAEVLTGRTIARPTPSRISPAAPGRARAAA